MDTAPYDFFIKVLKQLENRKKILSQSIYYVIIHRGDITYD